MEVYQTTVDKIRLNKYQYLNNHGNQNQIHKLRGFFILAALFYNISSKTQPNQKAR